MDSGIGVDQIGDLGKTVGADRSFSRQPDEHRMRIMSVVRMNPRKLGSFEEYTIALSRELTRSGGTSIVVFSDPPPPHLTGLFRESGAILETKPFGEFDRANGTAMRALIRKYQPDVVHLHFVSLVSLDALVAGMTPSVKLVFSDHISDVPGTRTYVRSVLGSTVRKAFAALPDLVVTPSEYIHRRSVLRGLNPSNVVTVYNGINGERFRGNPHSTRLLQSLPGIGPKTVIVLSVSNVTTEKGIGVLIDAASMIKTAGADVAFIHAGDGPQLQEFKAKVKSLGLEDRFYFTGLLDLPDVADLLRSSDIFTLPCTWGEAFSLSILEALAAGKPAVVTRVGGNPEAVVDGENGLIVPPRDPQALASAILRLYADPELRVTLGAEGRRRSAYFSMDRWIDDTIAQYNRILSTDKPARVGGRHAAA